jgi:hypothetical protein
LSSACSSCFGSGLSGALFGFFLRARGDHWSLSLRREGDNGGGWICGEWRCCGLGFERRSVRAGKSSERGVWGRDRLRATQGGSGERHRECGG